METNIFLTDKELDVASCVNWVTTPNAGEINIFVWTVREFTKNRKVVRLEFEAYEEMAIREMKKIAEAAANKWDVHRILIHHRTGTLRISEIPVIIAVSCSHRDAAFEACRYIIDTLKSTVPIWKKEIFTDGESWVAAHP